MDLGAIKDKVRVIKSISNDLEVSIAKATNHVVSVPKEKHVKKILSACRTGNSHFVVHKLAKVVRKSSDWVVVNKALQVFHRIMNEAPAVATDAIMQHPTVFNLASFSDTKTTPAFEQSVFIREYARYLEERLFTYRDTNVRTLSDSNAFLENVKKADIKKRYESARPMQRLMATLLDCRISSSLISNNTSLGAFALLLRDSFILYRILSALMLTIIDEFFKRDKKMAKEGLEIYELHTKQTDRLIKLFNFARTCKGINTSLIPELKPTPSSLIAAMVEYINDKEESGNTTKRNNVAMKRHDFMDDNDGGLDDVTTANLDDLLMAGAGDDPEKQAQKQQANKASVTSPQQQQQSARALGSPQQPAATRPKTPQSQSQPQQQSNSLDLLLDAPVTTTPPKPAKQINVDDLFSFAPMPGAGGIPAYQPQPQFGSPIQQQQRQPQPQQPMMPMGYQQPQQQMMAPSYAQPSPQQIAASDYNPFASFVSTPAPSQQQQQAMMMQHQQVGYANNNNNNYFAMGMVGSTSVLPQQQQYNMFAQQQQQQYQQPQHKPQQQQPTGNTSFIDDFLFK